MLASLELLDQLCVRESVDLDACSGVSEILARRLICGGRAQARRRRGQSAVVCRRTGQCTLRIYGHFVFSSQRRTCGVERWPGIHVPDTAGHLLLCGLVCVLVSTYSRPNNARAEGVAGPLTVASHREQKNVRTIAQPRQQSMPDSTWGYLSPAYRPARPGPACNRGRPGPLPPRPQTHTYFRGASEDCGSWTSGSTVPPPRLSGPA